MEQIDLELGPFGVRRRSVPLWHSGSRLTRGLEQGEQVIVRDVRTGGHFHAVVADLHVEPADVCYRVELGSRITSREAADWVGPTTGDRLRPAGERVSARELVELLAELRRGRRQLRQLAEDAH